MQNGGETSAEIFADWSLYDRVIHFDYMRHRELAGVIRAAAAQVPQPLRVLDLGCGDGRMARGGLCDFPVTSYIGVDLSPAALAAARTNLAQLSSSLEFRQADLATGLQETFAPPPNLLLASYSLHHYPAPTLPGLLSRMATLLQPGGMFVWIDLERAQHETRAEYLQRFAEHLSSWDSFDAGDRREIIAHMASSDYPLTASEKQQLTTAAGFLHTSTPYRDAFYAADIYSPAR